MSGWGGGEDIVLGALFWLRIGDVRRVTLCIYSRKEQVLRIGLNSVVICDARYMFRGVCAMAIYTCSVGSAQGCAEGVEKVKQYGAGASCASSIASG